MARNDHIVLILGTSHIVCIIAYHFICIALHCTFCLVLHVYSRISPIFLVSRLNRHGSDSNLSYLSFFPFFQCFRVKSSFSDTPANSEPDSDRCTRALASCMNNPNTEITTVETLLGILDSGFRFWLPCRLGFAFFACFVPLPYLFACSPVLIPCKSHSGDFTKDSDAGFPTWLSACIVFACLTCLLALLLALSLHALPLTCLYLFTCWLVITFLSRVMHV